MSPKQNIAVYHPEEEELNGLGMMILQYLEQNFDDFEYKVEQGRRLNGKVAVEVEKGIAVTVTFQGDKVKIENGVGDAPDLHLKGSYLILSKILTGGTNPFLEILKGNIKFEKFPKRPLQTHKILSFLKVPPELLLEPRPSWWRYIIFLGGAILLCGLLIVIVIYIN
jgi:putative sterol carrier protein